MIRDPVYREIDERLGGSLHEEAFERCAQALLQPLYPTLVPVRGGRDGGVDGVTVDLDGAQIVLVVTAAARVKRNLQTSLQSMLDKGNPCRRIVSATSRVLSAEKQNELREAARELGFQLIQIHEHAWFADALYRNPPWRKELLGLSGAPPALSIVPLSHRPLLNSSLIGHESEALWLKDADGDRLLVGQPGSGKTFLLSHVARTQGWLFVTSTDLGLVADGIREQKPEALICDDANADPEFVMRLAKLRHDIGSEVPIIASCWPGALQQLAGVLHATDAQIRTLRPLTRPEVAKVLESAGLHGPENLVYEILNQADGRPGLAATLAHLCLSGNERDLERVLLGNALLDSIRGTFERLLGPASVETLAAFSVGGYAGMQMQVVADFLGKPVSDVRNTVIGLGAGGVIHDIDGKHLSVRPPELRSSLIRDVYFCGATALDIEPLLQAAPDQSLATRELVKARQYGAAIPDELLQRRLLNSESVEAMLEFAWLGAEQCKWLLDKHPVMVGDVAHPALFHAPEIAIPLLLTEAIGDERPLHSHPDHRLRMLEDWVKEGLPGTPEPIRRRKALHAAALEWLQSDRDPVVGLQALAVALNPSFRSYNTDPVLGNRLTVQWGLLNTNEIDELAALWDVTVSYLLSRQIAVWKPALFAIENWVYPQRHCKGPITNEFFSNLRQVAADVVRKLAQSTTIGPGVIHSLSDIAKELDIDCRIQPNQDFEAVFPPIPSDAKEMERQSEAIRELASRWRSESPQTVVNQLMEFEREAQSVNETNRLTTVLMGEMADETDDPLEWVRALLSAGASGDLIYPYLARAASLQVNGWEDAVAGCLARKSTRPQAVQLVLTLAAPPERLLERTMHALDGLSKTIEHLCRRQLIPEETLGRLLTHQDDAVASRTALGMWTHDRGTSIPASLADQWRVAVLRSNREEYWFSELAKSRSDIAFDWLQQEIQNGDKFWSRHSPAVQESLKSISRDQRREVLKKLPGDFWSHDVVAWLVGDDADLLRELLALPKLEHLHLAPLEGYPDEGNWIEKAKVAITGGYSPEKVACAAYGSIASWSGKESDMYLRWEHAFTSLSADTSKEIRQVSCEGREIAEARRHAALERERREETFRRP